MKTRIAIATPFFERHALTEASVKWNRQVFEDAGFEVDVFLVGSEGKASKALAERLGATYEEVPNDPLGYKFVRSVQVARGAPVDFVVWIGSDDFLSREYVALTKLYIERYDQDLDIISGRSCYLWQHGDDEVFFARNYTTDIGAVMSVNFLDRLRWEVFDAEATEKLDLFFKRRVISRARRGIVLDDCRAYPILDVKTDVGMYSIRSMRRRMRLERMPADEVLSAFVGAVPDELQPNKTHRNKTGGKESPENE